MNLEMSSPAADARGQAGEGAQMPGVGWARVRAGTGATRLPWPPLPARCPPGHPLAPWDSPGARGQLAGQRGRREGEAAAASGAKEGREGEEGGAALTNTWETFPGGTRGHQHGGTSCTLQQCQQAQDTLLRVCR